MEVEKTERQNVEFRVSSRYDYWAVDVYVDNHMVDTAIAGLKTRKLAEQIANELQKAHDGWYDKMAKITLERKEKQLNQLV